MQKYVIAKTGETRGSRTALLNNMIILKQIVGETQKCHYHFSRPNSSCVNDQSMQNIVLIN